MNRKKLQNCYQSSYKCQRVSEEEEEEEEEKIFHRFWVGNIGGFE